MIRKNLLSIALFTIIAFTAGCGGSGPGPSNKPDGINPGVASVVKLIPHKTIVQTNSQIDITTRVFDKSGIPVSNVPVTFINLSSIGTFVSAPEAAPSEAQEAVSNIVLTDGNGFATITVWSPQEGFLTILVEINVGQGQVRDKQTIFFTRDLSLIPDLKLEVDSNLNGIYDELGDFVLLDVSNVVRIRATVYDKFGMLASGVEVTFETDVPFRVGQDPTAQCSDESDTCEIYFLDGNIRTTDGNGQAFVDINVFPTTLRDYQKLFNVTALADNGASDMVTLFIEPVLVASVVLSADPSVVEPAGTSEITAAVTIDVGGPVFDGTVVSFTTTPTTPADPDPCGSIVPFGQTTFGLTENVAFTAPTEDGTCTITGTVFGMSGSVDVTVAAVVEPVALLILPGTISTFPGVDLDFNISNGTPAYITTSQDPSIACNDVIIVDGSCAGETGIWTGTPIVVTIDPTAPAGAVVLDVIDSIGGTTSATITVVEPIDTIPPTVLWTIPIDTATNVAVDADIVVRFSEDIDDTTLNSTTFFVYDDTAGAAFDAGCSPPVSYQSSTFTATYSIGGLCNELATSNDYTVTLTTDIRDLQGNPLAAPYVFSFTTAP